MNAKRHPFTHAAAWLRQLLHGDAGAGILLIGVALAALVLANSPAARGYHAVFHTPLAWTPIAALATGHAWINDGLMALFFFVVGLELKRELLDGQLASPAQRRLPVLAAAAGMAVPAALYWLITRSNPALHPGWAIPAATDIAFAIGVLSLLGPRAPPALRLFLLSVAIVDDLGAVLIIAVAYTSQIAPGWLGLAGLIWAGMVVLNRCGIKRGWAYALPALALWYAMLHSGVHPTIAGVAAAFTIPLRLDARGDSLLLRMEHILAPISAYGIVPLFGFANAGVALPNLAAADTSIGTISLQLPLAVALGLFAGKQLGILGALHAARITGFAAPPAGASARHLWGVALLGGIGFTMSLFIAQLAFPAQPALIEAAKLGVIAGSLLAALAGYAVLRSASAPAA
ncbi:MAG: Na+/H+ antiporter NhaA [Pseudomonadota bacterium]